MPNHGSVLGPLLPAAARVSALVLQGREGEFMGGTGLLLVKGRGKEDVSRVIRAEKLGKFRVIDNEG